MLRAEPKREIKSPCYGATHGQKTQRYYFGWIDFFRTVARRTQGSTGRLARIKLVSHFNPHVSVMRINLLDARDSAG